MRARREAVQPPQTGSAPRFAPMWTVVHEAIGYLRRAGVRPVKAKIRRSRDVAAWALGPVAVRQRSVHYFSVDYYTVDLVIYEDGTWDSLVEVEGTPWPLGNRDQQASQLREVKRVISTRSSRERTILFQAPPDANRTYVDDWDFWDQKVVGRYFPTYVGIRWKTLPDGTTVQDNYDYEWKTWAAYVTERLPLLK